MSETQQIQSVLVAERQDSPIFKALRKVFSLLSAPGLPVISTADPAVFASPSPRLGVAVCFTSDDFSLRLSSLHAAGCIRFVLATPIPDNTLLATLPVSIRDVIGRHCEFTPPARLVQMILSASVKTADSYEAAKSLFGLGCTLHARALYPYMRKHSHGGHADITNAFLASARMLAKSPTSGSDQEITSVIMEWNNSRARADFDQTILTIEKQTVPAIGIANELVTQWRSLCDICKRWTSAADNTQLASIAEKLMILLTDCRLNAGMPLTGDNNTIREVENNVSPITNNTPKAFRILVVDDHAERWRPVFQVLQRLLRCEPYSIETAFDFSVDGKHICGHVETQLCARVSDYDAVILDEFINGMRGTTLLKQIRDANRYTPVVMWTSARDVDIAGGTALANGMLFKKTTTLEKIAETLTRWCEEGQTKRKCSLLNTYFNDVIRSPGRRECLHAFEIWALKLYASFHAQNASCYLTFNDHSGRHILIVLDRLAHFTKHMNPAPDQDLLFCMYLGGILHEIGMFPLSNESGHFDDIVGNVRKWHALRGLVILIDAARRTGDFDKVSDCWGMLGNEKQCSKLVALTAIMVGYHARNIDKLYDIADKTSALSEGRFLGSPEPEKLSKSSSDYRGQDITLPDVKSSLTKLHKYLSHDVRKATKPIVRKAAALLRFADSLDIDYTRNPVQRFTLNLDRNFRDNVENLKREVVRRVEVEDGRVVIDVASPSADNNATNRLAEYLDGKGHSITKSVLTKPWEAGNRDAIRDLKLSIETELLTPFWEYVSKTREAPRAELPHCHPLYNAGKGLTKKRNSRPISALFAKFFKPSGTGTWTVQEQLLKDIALWTALCVAGDLVDEYQGIIDCDLKSIVDLGTVEWGKGSWRDLSLLTTGLMTYGIAPE